MIIKLLAGDLKLAEELEQLPAETVVYVGQGRGSLVDAINAPHGVPAGNQFSVDVSYDARMINSLDINTTVTSNYLATIIQTLNVFDPPLVDSGDSNVVPTGYIFVIRSIGNFICQDLSLGYGGLLGTDLYAKGQIEIKVDNSTVKTGKFTVGTGYFTETWIIVDENQSITFSLTGGVIKQLDILTSGLFNPYWKIDVYGQLIEKSTAKQFVISNPKAGAQTISAAKGILK